MKFLRSLNINKWQAIVCIIGFILNFIAYYPGFLSPDSFDQYSQALAGQYNDWHSPIMAVIWHAFIWIYPGTLLILVFQLGLLWTSIYLLLNAVKSKLWYVLVLLFSLAPFVQNFAAYIIKDTQMVFSWLLAVAIIFRAGSLNKKLSSTEILICFLLIAYGSWVRINALPGSIALCYLLSWIIFKNRSKYIRLVSAIFCWVIIGAGHWYFDYDVVKAEKTWPQTKLYLHDITGIYARTGISLYPSFLFSSSNFDTAVLRKGYHPASFDHLWVGKNDSEIYYFEDDSTVRILQEAWKKSILTYPAVYFQNRTDGFLYYLRIKDRGNVFNNLFAAIYPVPNALGISFRPNILSHIFLTPIEVQRGMPYMKPWFWLLLNLLLLAFIGKFRNLACSVTYKALVLSGILYILPTYFIFPCDTDFRYFYWNCIACSLALCMLLVDRFYFAKQGRKV